MYYFLALVAVWITSQSYAQGVVTFREDFNNNEREWLVGSNEATDMTVENGTYKLVHKNENTYYLWNYHYIDPSKDYSVEAVLTQTAGPADAAFGLIWNIQDVNNSVCFQIACNKMYSVFEYEEEKYKSLVEWSNHDAIKPVGEPNKLQIVKTQDKVSFRINGVEVHTLPAVRMHGPNVGVYIQGVMTVTVDYIEVKQQKRPEINLVTGLAKGFPKENLGPNVNSEHGEICPLISADGNTLFMVRYAPDNVGGDAAYSDCWVSTKQADGTWGPRKNMGFPINNTDQNNVFGMLPDNNTILCANQYTEDGAPDGAGFSESHRTTTGWSIPTRLQVENYQNKAGYVESCLGPSSDVIIVSAEAPKNYGSRDLYAIFRRTDGTWSEPMNLGPQVNTPAEDMSPFLAADNITLYFSTEGYPGYGDHDIFVTRRLDDSWQKWSEPQNLGSDINTDSWEAYFSVPASGEYAYLASWANSMGQGDIFRVKLPDALKPVPVFLVSGTVYNAKTKEPIDADIYYETLPEGKSVGSASSAPVTGDYTIALTRGKQYGFRGEKKGYYPVSDNLDARDLKQYTEIKKDLYLVPIELGEVIRINNVFFDFAKATLREESYPELDRVVKFMQENPSLEIELAGHTDNVGSDDANLKLSQDRITSVKAYLVSKAIDTARLTAKGFGEAVPISTNDTEEGRQHNRRVEFKITKK